MKYGFIGAGNMGSAIAKAICKKVNPKDLAIADKVQSKALALANELNCSACETQTIADECDIIFLGVKPQMLIELAQEIALRIEVRQPKPTLVSMLAGVEIKKINAIFKDCPVIRIMPNIPVAVGEGMILLSKNSLVEDDVLKQFKNDMSESGEIDEINEMLIDAGSAVSGCGPAFVSLFVEALADGGVKAGLSRDKALLYASQTLLGTAQTIKDGVHPAVLKDLFCSPAGTTIAGVQALESGAFRASVMNAVEASYEKTLKIGK